MSLIDESGERYVRMAHLATVGSSCGERRLEPAQRIAQERCVARLLRDVAGKISNKTNGVTPRRWMVLANPRLAHFITRAIGSDWVRNLYELRGLEPLIEDAGFRASGATSSAQQDALAAIIRERTGVVSTGCHLRRAGQTHPRVQAPASEYPARDRSLSPS